MRRMQRLIKDRMSQEAESDQETIEPGKYPEHTGGGWFNLSNGQRVRGKLAALAAESALV